jgi:tripeptide aminopeptidase
MAASAVGERPMTRANSSGPLEPEWQATLYRSWRKRRAWVLDEQVAIADVPAPTGKESARADHLQQRLQHIAGLAVTRDAIGNVCAVVSPMTDTVDARAALPPLVCLAHLDTVYSAATHSSMQRDGVMVRGMGIGDNGRGLAALMALAHALPAPSVRRHLTRPVHLVATVGEEGEGNLRGARAWFDDAAAREMIPYAAIAIDGPGDRTIVHHAVGSRRLRIAVHGSGGHSWVDGTAANPLHALGALLTRIAALQEACQRRAGERTTVQVTRMQGGECLTAIPRAGWIDVDLRSSSARALTDVHRTLTRFAHETASGLAVDIIALGDRPAGTLAADHALVQLAVACTERVGRVPQSAIASTDANIPLSRGIPAIAIGAGGAGGGAHTADEWYSDEGAEVGLERVLRVVMGAATDARS